MWMLYAFSEIHARYMTTSPSKKTPVSSQFPLIYDIFKWKKYNIYFILPVALKYSKDHDGDDPGNVG